MWNLKIKKVSKIGNKDYEKINYTFDDSNKYECAGRGNFKKRGKS